MTDVVPQAPGQSPAPGPKRNPDAFRVNTPVLTLSLSDFIKYTRVLAERLTILYHFMSE
jgi:hypothetical protein